MKLISFLHHNTPSYGIVQGDDVLNLTPLLGAQAPDLKSLQVSPTACLMSQVPSDSTLARPGSAASLQGLLSSLLWVQLQVLSHL